MKYDCLNNLIGIQTNCETITGQSAYHVLLIPGIDLPTANGIDADYKTGIGLIKRLLEFSYDLVGDEVLKSLQSSYRFNEILNQGYYCYMSAEYNGVYPGTRGVRIKRRFGNNYMALNIPSVRICTETAANVTLTITEANGKTKTLSSVTVAAKTPTELLIDYEVESEWADITYDATVVSMSNTPCSSGCSSCNTYQSMRYDDYVEVCGVTDGVESMENTFGIVPCVQAVCSTSKLICSIRKQIDLLCLYKFAGLFFQEAALSKRNNRYTLYTREDAQAKSFYYDNIDGSGLYQQETVKVLQTIRGLFNSSAGICFTCIENHYGHITP